MIDKKLFGSIDTSFIDMKGQYALVLYFTGCNFNCPYCFNKELVMSSPVFSIRDIKENYKNLLSIFPNINIVLTGGEPTCNPYFPEMCDYFYENHKLGLHTNGYILPLAHNIFDTVIIGIKSRMDGIGDFETYKRKMANACKFYSSARRKELRLVDVEEMRKDYTEVLNFLSKEGCLEEYQINYIKRR